MIEEARYDWNLYKEIVLTKHINLKKLESSSIILQKIVNEKKYSEIPIGYLDFEKINSIENGNTELLEALSKILKLKKDEVFQFIEAYNIAKKCYERMKNITVSSLLKKISKSELSNLFFNLDKEAELADRIFKLGRLYYDYAEKR